MKPPNHTLKLWVIVLLLGSALVSSQAGALVPGYEFSQQNKDSILKHLRPALMSCGGAGRIYYSTTCAAKDGTPLPFPRVKIRAMPKGMTGLAAVREIFKNDKHVQAFEDKSGMIRVTIGHPEFAILETNIHRVALSVHEQYNPTLAIFAILNSKDVEVAMHRLGFDQPTTVFSGGISLPEEGWPKLPHLPPSIKNMTLDQALDVVAKTFGGVVIYQTCTNPNGKSLVSLDFG